MSQLCPQGVPRSALRIPQECMLTPPPLCCLFGLERNHYTRIHNLSCRLCCLMSDVHGQNMDDGSMDGEHHGDGAESSVRPSYVSRRVTKRARASAPVAGDVCHACQESGACDKQYHGLWFHPQCWNAVRSRHRQLGKSSSMAVESDMQLMRRNPEEWRDKIALALKAETRGASRRATRDEAVKFEELAVVNSNLKVKDQLELTKRQCKTWEMWEGMESEEASSDFERELEVQDRADSVLVSDIIRHRTVEGEERRSGHRLSKRNAPSPPSARDASPSPVPRTRRSSPRRSRVYKTPSASPRRRGRSRARSSNDGRKPSSRCGTGSPAETAKGKQDDATPTMYEAVAFMQRKKELQAQPDALVDTLSGPMGCSSQLASLITDLGKKKVSMI